MSIQIDDISLSLPSFFNQSKHSQIAVLVDENTRAHCYPKIKSLLPEHQLIEVASGEINKNLQTCEHIWKELTRHQFDRKALLVNLGGGVIGDMGGFCAVAYKRGIDFINIPTTLLATVDANIGGKLGIDFHGFKNHLGFFQDPLHVFIDPIFLETLPERELRSGFAEVVKHGLIADADYFEKVSSKGLKQENWNAVIAHSIHIKDAVVKEDPKERGLRKILNFGHTIGHAIESYYLHTENRLLHGEAIAIGMICESYLSGKLLGLSDSAVKTISQTLKGIYPELRIEKRHFTSIIELMYHDKKNINNFLNHSLLYEIGRAGYDIAVDEKDVMDSLFYYSKT
ncbi:3-dehydroquinate synthase [Roseivirga thermotolerans]|uniref:3-dehydroquinate synthase n=1 Tax=Roseivirga thermotolerans TaxID=1758176 RepID=A0ABQ3I5K6_9BACT|nr:3-dehydroquinate synthase [Roseivirga thermotolerans]GHE66286.1 3-dehydroquinate synthase [Roseivirga thermotolerans]